MGIIKISGVEVADAAEAYEIGLAAGREEGYEQGYERGWNDRSRAQAEIEREAAAKVRAIKNEVLAERLREHGMPRAS